MQRRRDTETLVRFEGNVKDKNTVHLALGRTTEACCTSLELPPVTELRF